MGGRSGPQAEKELGRDGKKRNMTLKRYWHQDYTEGTLRMWMDTITSHIFVFTFHFSFCNLEHTWSHPFTCWPALLPSVPPSCPVAEPICPRLRHAHLPAPVHAKTTVNNGVVCIYSCMLWIIIITYSIIYIPQKKNIYAWCIVILLHKTFCLRKMVSSG